MLPANLEYAAPTSIADAVALIPPSDPFVIGGSYRTVIDLKMRRISPRLLIDLRKIPELYGIQPDGGGLRIGAMTTLRALTDDDAIRQRYAALAEAAEASGDPQMRNMETLGGDLTYYEAAESDVIAALLALDARIHVTGIADDTLTASYFASLESLSRGEFITAVSLPAPAGVSTYEKFKHPATLAPICGVAVRVTLDANNVVQSCAFAVTGATDRPVRLSGAESALIGQPLNEDTIAQVASAAGDGLEFVSDLYASGDYRAHLVEVLLKRALARLAR